MIEIQQFSTDTIPSHISKALLTVLRTTDQPERIWTANWSTPQIQHLEALLLGSHALPTSQAGWTMVNDTLVQLSRILSRTALHMWTCKVLLETSHRLHHRRRLREAQATVTATQHQHTDTPLATALPDSTTDTTQSPVPSPRAQDPPLPSNLRRPRSPSPRSSTPPLKRRRGHSFISPITAPAQPTPHGAFIFPTVSQSYRLDL